MVSFKEREIAFEAKYLHDEELNFKINAKRNHLFGLWTASLLGYTGEKAKTYAEDVMMIDLQKPLNKTVLSKVIIDLKAASVNISEHRVQKEFERCWDEAKNTLINKKVNEDG